MIGDKLQELLDMKGIKVSTLSKMTGINHNTIYSIIRRNNKNVAYSIIEKIADALDVPVEYFYDREPVDTKNLQPTPDDDELEEFILLFEKLSDDRKKFLIAALRGLVADQE